MDWFAQIHAASLTWRLRAVTKVFISYSHDSREQTQLVLQLANSLRSHGVDAELDQYYSRPPVGWPRWCEEQLRPENSEFVLVICTQSYRNRIEGKVLPDDGRGVFWEGGIIYSYLYNEKENTRFVPILLPGAREEDIPRPLRDTTRYSLTAFDPADPQFEALLRELTHRQLVIKPQLGSHVRLPPVRVRTSFLPESNRVAPSRLPHIANSLVGRDEELRCLTSAWNNPAVHVGIITAWGGVGKTSLVAHWQAGLAQRDYDGADYFDWSFYSQGAREQGAVSADAFIAAALEFFGDPEAAKSAAAPWDKGARLAQLVSRRRTLLVLDGLEPLQYPPTSPLTGQMKERALTALLKGLAAKNPGLCLVTTRDHVADLAPFRHSTTPEWELRHLAVLAGVQLLRSLGVQGSQAELRQLVKDVKGHALTLNLLGRYLVRAHAGNIRRRDLVKFEEADAEEQGGHAFRVMDSYVRWLAAAGEKGHRALAVLRLLGLFDRPADAGCLASLRRTPAIPGLTEALVDLADTQWNLAVSSLADCGLVFSAGDESSTAHPQPALDCHPLVREYFEKQLRETNLEAWRTGHRRLYEHLRDSTPDRPQPTLEDLQPLYQAVAHGCNAGMYSEALECVHTLRISRGDEYYSTQKLGAFSADLGSLACFFDRPWSVVSNLLDDGQRALVLGEAASYLAALGRPSEALEPMRVALEMRVSQGVWTSAAVDASNLSELELTLGELAEAERDATKSVVFADRSGDVFQRLTKRVRLAEALHTMGRREDALELFREAEGLQVVRQPQYPLLCALQGFLFCDLLLAPVERAAWKVLLTSVSDPQARALAASCHDVERRAMQTLDWTLSQPGFGPLPIALNHLALGQTRLYQAILEESEPQKAKTQLEKAVDGLRRAGRQYHLPRGLLSRAWLRRLSGEPAGAQADLDEAYEIAERGPMRLFLADIHLHRVRLFFREEVYPWASPQADMAEAKGLIDSCGYWRRNEELEDAGKAIA